MYVYIYIYAHVRVRLLSMTLPCFLVHQVLVYGPIQYGVVSGPIRRQGHACTPTYTNEYTHTYTCDVNMCVVCMYVVVECLFFLACLSFFDL